MSPSSSAIRPVRLDDVPAVVAMVHELAAYERAPDDCHLTEEQLRAALFADHPSLFGHLALDGDHRPVGFALWFLNYSTWEGGHGIYVEDLYVRESARGGGLGRALLAELAAICVERGYARLDWAVLTWNEPAVAFYRRSGAQPQDEWTSYRLTTQALRSLAAQAYPRLAAKP